MASSRWQFVAVLAGLLLAAPVLSYAQGPGGGGGGGRGRGGFGRGGGAAGLLMMEEVQKELSITDEQKTELTKVMESLRPAGGPGGFNREEFENLSEEERAKKMDELRKEGEERAKKAEEAIKTVLKPEQLTRLSELRLQREGVRSWSREDVQKQLNLTDEQKAKIKTLTDAQGQGGDFRNFRDMSDEERAKAREEMEARREAFDKGMAEVLTPEQKETWAKLQGAKFEFPQRGFGGGQGGGRRRRPE